MVPTAAIAGFLTRMLASKLGVNESDINTKRPFFSIGVSSLISEEIRASLGESFEGLSSTLLFEYPSVQRLSRYLASLTPIPDSPLLTYVKKLHDDEKITTKTDNNSSCDFIDSEPQGIIESTPIASGQDILNRSQGIAIIGMSGRFPKAANPSELWQNLLTERDCISEIPSKRWDAEYLFKHFAIEGLSITGKWGGFLDDIEYFDPLFFQIPHREAEMMDPQQKLFLQCGWELMEDAGYANSDTRATDKIGVYAGVTWNEFSAFSRDEVIRESDYKGAGSLYWSIPNRLSYFLNLTGPSVAIDTACSSSLVAIHDACQAINNGDCEMAIAGGINLNLHPAKYQFLSQNHFLSSDGRCRSFGEGGDGYVPSEGVAAILLKPLANAIADGDHIHGVVKGTATNHGGKVTGYTVPNPIAHTEVIGKAIARSGYTADQISYVECHGTGTDLGDPIEIAGLSGVFGASKSRKDACVIGSLKSNIGHLEAAAGVAGIIKIMLSMRERTLPASLHASNENKKLKLQDTAFRLVKSAEEWGTKEEAVRAGISSFGAGGSNAHIILESYESNPTSITFNKKHPQVFLLSAESEGQLKETAENILNFLKNGTNVSLDYGYLRNICFSLLAGRSHFTYRLAMVVGSIAEIKSGLTKYLGASIKKSAQKGKLASPLFVGHVTQNVETIDKNDLQSDKNWKSFIVSWAKTWIEGRVDVTSLLQSYANFTKGKRISLPTYPFLKERSWLREGYPLVPILEGIDNVDRIHPLIDSNTSSIYKQSFVKEFNVSEFILKDHLVNEVNVIPGVCHLEMARVSAENTLLDKVVEVKDVWFSNVISVKDRRKVEVQLQVDGEELSYQIWDPENETIFSRGKICWPDNQQEAESVDEPVIDLASITESMRDEWLISDVYKKFVETGVIQKHSFQVIKRLQFGVDKALAHLVLPENRIEQFRQFGFHPSLMDGIVQTAMMHAQYLFGKDVKILPFHFSSVKMLKPMEQDVTVCSTVLDQEKMQFDLALYNKSGELLINVSNFILREMKEDTAHEEQTRKSQNISVDMRRLSGSTSMYYSHHWTATGKSDVPAWHSVQDNRSILVLNAAITEDEAILSRFPGAILVTQADTLSNNGNHHYLDQGNLDHIQKLVKVLKEQSRLPEIIVYCDDYNLPPVENTGITCGEVLFLLSKALLIHSQKASFVVFSSNTSTIQHPLLAAATGFFKTLSVEKPGFTGRVITLEDTAPSLSNLLACACVDIKRYPYAQNVRYNGELREEKSYIHLSQKQYQPATKPSASISKDGVYLISGGMGGIGLIFAKKILKEYGGTVYLTGRSAIDADKKMKLASLSELGGSAHYAQCDVTIEADVKILIDTIIREHGMLNGILHSAGKIDDGFILRKDQQSFRSVIAPKITGTLHLDKLTSDLKLDFFCLFSSVTAILGNLGQCDYGYANAFVDNFSTYRNNQVKKGTRQGKTLSINWPYWQNGGMTLSNKEAENLTKMFGFVPLENRDGLQALSDGLASVFDQIAVLDGNHKQIQKMLSVDSIDSIANKKPESTTMRDPENNTDAVKDNAVDYLKTLFAEELKIPRERIDSKSSFDKYGFDSIVMIDLINIMEKKFSSLPKTLFFEYHTIDQLSVFLVDQRADHFRSADTEIDLETNAARTESSPLTGNNSTENSPQKPTNRFAALKRNSHTPNRKPSLYVPSAPLRKETYSDAIAIIGVAGRYPEAENIDTLWQNIASGKDCVREIPESLWDWKTFYQKGKPELAKSYSKWGGFIDNVDQFDAQFFNISPKEAENMDPQERLFLQTATHAIQDAGYTAATLSCSKDDASDHPVGVFVGVMWGDYQLYGVQSSDPDQWKTPRSFYWSIANRLSFYYNFSGPSMAIDTACSSSLTALHLACESLRRGEINAAITGGVNLTLHPNKYNLLSELQFLSTDGRCRSFGEGGDGYVPGDGVGAVILKRLADAEADGDQIYAVIRGTSINHGGKTSGFTVPNPHRQAALVKNALQTAGVNPRHVSYVEAHGTGTSLGDPIEMIGLQKAYDQQDKCYCAIGSIKSNIGHLEAAAGIAALTKVLLQFKHKKIAPSIHSKTLNNNISFDSSPFYVQRELDDWTRPQFQDSNSSDAIVEIPRIAGISSFGAGGSNAHVVLEEYVDERIVLPQQKNSTEYTFVLSAHTAAALTKSAQQLSEFLDTSDIPLDRLAYTLQLGREPMRHRLAIIARDHASLQNALNDFTKNHKNSLYFTGTVGEGGESVLNQLFDSDADIKNVIAKWIKDGTARSLASAWISGIAIPWENLYEKPSPIRVALPGYPFETRRFWTSLPAIGKRGVIHPLIDENLSGFERIVFTKSYNETDELIAQHKVFGKPTLPGSVALSMAVQSLFYANAFASKSFEISNVHWEKPIQILDSSISIECELVNTQKNEFVFEVGIQDSEHSSVQSPKRIPCVQGEIRLTEIEESLSNSTFNLDFKAVDNSAILFGADEIHHALSQSGFVFGERFECFQSAQILPGKAIVKILGEERGAAAGTLMPPIALDAALRSSLLIDASSDVGLKIDFQIPIDIKQLRILKPLETKSLYVVAVHSETSELKNNENSYDIDAYDENGNKLIEIRGLITRIIEHKASTKPTSNSTETRNLDVSVLTQVEYWLKQLVAEVTKLDADEIDAELALEKYGIDSVMVMALNEKLESVFGDLSKTLFYEYQNISSLAKYFGEHHADAVNRVASIATPISNNTPKVESQFLQNNQEISRFLDLASLRNKQNRHSTSGQKSIAIIGVSGRYPKSDTIQEFWQNLIDGRDCIEDIPSARWNLSEYYEASTIDVGKSSSRWGGFIDGHDKFDAALFKILPGQAAKMDPQERLFLQTVWSTLEDAGYSPSTFSQGTIHRNVGVFAGSMWNHYSLFGLENTALGTPDVTYGWDASIANRVSYFYDFNGPSMMVDTACSSSLLAIHNACESLMRGECKYAIAGGVNLSIHPYKYTTLTQMQMLSSDGRSKSFGLGGDGYVPGEGVGAVLLKPLNAATEDGDHIYAVIKGSAVNHNGKTNGFTVPNPVAQEEGIQLALSDAGITAADIGYFEGHGTGTKLGDPIEFNALNKLLKTAGCNDNSCALGSVKSNIGHLEGAAGIVALTKAILQIKHKCIVPSLHSCDLNPNMNVDGAALYIPQQLKTWASDQGIPRRAAISSLGAGGANAFVVVEEYTADNIVVPDSAYSQLILITAKTRESLRGNVENLLNRVENSSNINLADLAFTLQSGRIHLEHRICLIVTERVQLLAILREVLDKLSSKHDTVSKNFQYAHLTKIADRSWWPTGDVEKVLLTNVELPTIADQWIGGVLDDRTVRWESLHQGYTPKKIPLPTYVFDEQRFWAEQSSNINQKKVGITPLLDENRSNFFWQFYRKTFYATDSIVADHIVAGKTIIAGSVLLEMALTATHQSMELHRNSAESTMPVMRVSNISWQHAAIVENTPITIGVLLLPLEKGAHFTLLPGEIAEAILERKLDSESADNTFFIAGDISFEPNQPLAHHNLDLLINRFTLLAETKADIYDYYQSLGLDYGDYFRVTESIYVDNRQAISILYSNDNAYNYSNKCLSPAIIDGALRTALLAITSHTFSGDLSHTPWKQLLVPHSIKNLSIYASLPQRVYCLVDMIDVDITYQTYAILDISLLDEKGNVCAKIERFRAVAPSIEFYSNDTISTINEWKSDALANQTSISITQATLNDNTVESSLYRDADLDNVVSKFLKNAFAKATGIPSIDVQYNQTFDAIGVDSITIVKLNRILDSSFSKLSKTIFFECKSLEDIHSYLLKKHRIDVVSLHEKGVHTLSALKKNEQQELNDSSQETLPAAPIDFDSVFVQSIRQLMPLDIRSARPDSHIMLLDSWPDSIAAQLPFHVTRVHSGESFSAKNEQEFHVNLKSPQDVDKLFSQLSEADNVPDIIVVFDDDWLDYSFKNKDDSTSIALFNRALEKVTVTLLNLIQSIHRLKLNKQLRVICGYRSFGSNRQPHWDALEGLAHSLLDVSDSIRLSLLRLHSAIIQDDQRLLSCLIDECSSVSDESCMLEYDARGRRYQYISQDTSMRFSERQSLSLKPSGIYLVTGGAGAIGHIMAQYLRDQAESQSIDIKLILLGRSNENDKIASQLEILHSSFCEASYQQVDIQRLEDVKKIIRQLTKAHSIAGVMHCAGISSSSSMLNSSYEEFCQPLGAKCNGTINLDIATASQQLDFFILFSSITAKIGDFGAGGYSFGNAFIDNFSHSRNLLTLKNKRYGRTLSIGWPLWDIEGIQQNNDLVDLYLDRFGLGKVTAQLGVEVLEKAWERQYAHVAYYYGDKKRIHETVLQQGYLSINSLNMASENSQNKKELPQNDIAALRSNSKLTKALDKYQKNSVWQFSSLGSREDIAIVGVSGRYPEAPDLDRFWENLCEGRDSISEIPSDRWDYRANYSDNRELKEKTHSKWGGFLSDIDLFDAQYFNISPREAELLDPQERLFLQTSLHCLDDAGYTRQSLATQTVGVFVGVMWGQYQLFDVTEEQKQYGLPGSSFSAVANRVSYCFDFCGPSISLDTMCSSSLTALHSARLSIQSGECDYALAGGVNLSLHEKKYQQLSHGQFLSSDGRCRSFGDGGDGYVPGEGVGVVLLKRLDDAIKDGDQIYGVLKSSAVNHGGKTNGFTVPNPNAQCNVIAKTIHEAGWNPETLSYLEAHGTGTSLGDPIEITGLQNAFSRYTDKKQFCTIGSVKSNIGHLESAAGMAGLTKVLLQIKHKKLVPSLHSAVLNSNIEFEATAFKLSTEIENWQRPLVADNTHLREYPLRAGVSSFGAGGANAHILVEEYCSTEIDNEMSVDENSREFLFLFSARNDQRLRILLDNMRVFSDRLLNSATCDNRRLADIAYTLMVGREQERERIAIIATDIEDFTKKLDAAINGTRVDDLYVGNSDKPSQLDTVLSPEQRRDLVNDFVVRGDLAGISGAWVSGITIDWLSLSKRLFKSAKTHRISLPVTPLLPKRCWVDESRKQRQASVPVIHPLLDTNDSTLFQQAYSKVFTGDEFYLADHIIGIDNPAHLLPGVAYIEMARAAAQHALSGHDEVIGVSSLEWLAPISEQQLNNKVTILLGDSDGKLTFEVVSAVNGSMETHSRGSLAISKTRNKTNNVFDIASEVSACGNELGMDAINQYFKRIGYHDGPSFQSAQHVYYSNDKAISRLSLPTCITGGCGDYQLHPSLMDAALRTCLFVGGPRERMLSIVPFAIDHIVFYDKLPSDCYALSELISEPENDNYSLRRYNVYLLDSQGSCLVEILGFSAREIQNVSKKLQYFQREWTPDSLDSVNQNIVDSPVLIVGKDVKAFTEKAGFASANTITVEFSTKYSRDASNHFSIRSNHEGDLAHVLRVLLEESILPERIVLVSGFDLSNKNSLGDEIYELSSISNTLSDTAIPLLNLFKSLNKYHAKNPYRILCTYARSDNGNPYQEALSALAKSVVQVNHKIEIGCIGLDKDACDIASIVSDELKNTQFHSGIEIQYSSGERLLNKFSSLNIKTPDKTFSQENLFVDGSVVLITGGMGQLGQILTKYLVANYNVNIVLTGRSPESERTRDIIENLSSGKNKVVYLSSDIAHLQSLKDTVESIQGTIGRVKVILHCAGVVDDRNITELKEDDFQSIIEPKVHGLLSLMQFAKESSVGHIICFSSISSFLGDIGGGAYAYANRFMDAYTDLTCKINDAPSQPKLISVNWPLWIGGGMQLPEDQKAFNRYTGIYPITEEDGIVAFETILQIRQGTIAVCSGESSKILKTLGITPLRESVSSNANIGLKKNIDISLGSDNLAKGPSSNVSGSATPLLTFILEEMSNVLKMLPSDIDHASRFESFGMDSVLLMEFNKRLSDKLPELPKTTLFEYDSVNNLYAYINKNYGDTIKERFGELSVGSEIGVPLIESSIGSPDDINESVGCQERISGSTFSSSSIDYVNSKLHTKPFQKRGLIPVQRSSRVAVIGLSGKFPESDSMEEFWSNVVQGKNCLREIPSDRWDSNKYYNVDSQYDQSTCCSKWGGFVSHVNYFDPEFFRMSENDAAALDPQLRLMLKIAWQALEDSAYAVDSLEQIPFGVYIGVMNSDYAWIASDFFHRTGNYPGPGSFASEIANRISYILNVTGPSLTVENACASSSTAVHLARQAILNGDCEMALAGGVNLSLHPGKYLMLDELKVLSPNGIESTFDADANGLVPSEGVGAVILKSYEKAVADGDHIYGVISGSAIGHSGVGPAMNLPSVHAMEKTIVAALEEAEVSGEMLGYIESHGTGTELGDPIELKALVNALRRYGEKNEYCAIGSKSNFGHLESASGICSLIKTLLALSNQTIPPCANIRELTPAFDNRSSPLYFPVKEQSFSTTVANKRYAGINSFGLGGSNAFFVLESHEHEIARTVVAKSALIFSAKSKAQVRRYIETFHDFLENNPNLDLSEVSFSLQVGRNHFSERLAMVVDSIAQCKDIIQRWISDEKAAPEVCSGNLNKGKDLCNLLSGSEGDAFISESVATANLEKLCELWVSGCRIPWAKLHRRFHNRCSLPTYPFSEKEYSLVDIKDNVTATAIAGQHTSKEFTDPNASTPLVVGWYKTVENSADNNTKDDTDIAIAALDVHETLTKRLIKQLPDIECVTAMTPVQINKYRSFEDSTSCRIKQVALTFTGIVDEEVLLNSWQAVANNVTVLRSVFTKNRKGYFRVILQNTEGHCVREYLRCFTSDKSLAAELDNTMKGFSPMQIPLEVRVCFNVSKSNTHLIFSFPEYVMHTNDAVEILKSVHRVISTNGDTFELDKIRRTDSSHRSGVIPCENTVKNYWVNDLKEHGEAKPFTFDSNHSGNERKYLSVSIREALVNKLQIFTQAEKVEFDVLLAAAWSVIQSRFTKSSHAMLALGGKFKSFDSEGFMGGVGVYDSRVPILIKTQVKSSIREWILGIQNQIAEKNRYAHIPIETIQKWLGVEELACCTLSVVDISMDLYGDNRNTSTYPLEKCLIREHFETPVAVVAVVKNSNIDLTIEYSDSLFDEVKAALVLQYIEVIFEYIVANASKNPAAISLMTKQEYRDRFWKTIEREDT